jgi:hypothetical protein
MRKPLLALLGGSPRPNPLASDPKIEQQDEASLVENRPGFDAWDFCVCLCHLILCVKRRCSVRRV